MELRDILLKKGDIVYLDTNVRTEILIDGAKLHQKEITHIIKIERPVKVKYKTIYEAPKPILDKKEKEYLEALIRPFRDSVKYIKKTKICFYYPTNDFLSEYIYIDLGNSDDNFSLPRFKEYTMYKGMELNKSYTLDELGLFKE